MTLITIRRTARKEHECDRCGQPITPGSPYYEHALTPRDSEIGNHTWWRSRNHVNCDEVTE